MIDWLPLAKTTTIPGKVPETVVPATPFASSFVLPEKPTFLPPSSPAHHPPAAPSWMKRVLSSAPFNLGLMILIVFVVIRILLPSSNKPSSLPPPPPPDALVRVLEVKPFYLKAERTDGKIVERTKGSISWRLNNPGKVNKGDFAKSHGAIGDDGKVVIFPDLASGRKAEEELLFEGAQFKDLSIQDAMKKFASEGDKYDPKKYSRDVASAAGVSAATKLSDLSKEQREKFLDQVQVEEGYKKGEEKVVK